MAQDLEYGDRDCEVRAQNESQLDYLLDKAGSNTTAEQYCEQRELQECESTNSSLDWCYWFYTGQGFQYQVLAGPVYIVTFAISGILLGMINEIGGLNKVRMLGLCIVTWSGVTVLAGAAQQYWHTALCRMLLGVFGAGCVPFSTSLLSQYFTSSLRGAAIGFFYWGVFLGYSLSFVLILVVEALDWRPVYLITGVPGIVLGIFVLITIKSPSNQGEEEEGAIRKGAGLVWAYNIVLCFDEYYPGTNVTLYMSWIPLVFGSAGVFGGGVLSDRLSRDRGISGRLIVLIGCCMHGS